MVYYNEVRVKDNSITGNRRSYFWQIFNRRTSEIFVS